jgi:hypothetical protein
VGYPLLAGDKGGGNLANNAKFALFFAIFTELSAKRLMCDVKKGVKKNDK